MADGCISLLVWFVQFYVFPPKWQKSLLTTESYQMTMEVTDLSGFLSHLIFTTISWFPFLLWSRLAKSTLTLIPLLGIHAILFTFVIDESVPKGSMLRLIRLFCDLLFNSFQVGVKPHTLLNFHFFTHQCQSHTLNISVFFYVLSLYVSFLKHPRSLNAFLLSIDHRSYKTGYIQSTHFYSAEHYSCMETY